MANVMYCLNGHFVGIVSRVRGARSWGHFRAMMVQAENEGPKRLPEFCATCGGSNISACQHCQTPFEVAYPGGTPGVLRWLWQALPMDRGGSLGNERIRR